ncbi:MAG: hypothetical protein Q8P67_28545, partial [archaeon]|nr:hypothetical protein [archaeon]
SPPSQPSISSLPPASSSTKLPPPAATAPPKKPSLFSRAKKPKKDKSNKPKPEKDMGFSDIAGQDQLIRIMTSPDLTLVKAVLGMCEIREKDRMAMCLVHLFELNGTTPHLVKTLIEQEIQETQPGTSAAASLFRGNSVATKILTAYSLITGTEYLKKTLKPLLSSVVYSSGGFEIDPNRLGPADSVKDNVQNLLAVVTMFTSKIMRSVDAVPFHLRKVLAHLSAVIRLKFPDAEVAVLGSFFFLRFICPTIISPLESGIWTDKIPPHSARCLVLISKTLQNLANGVLFGQKEPFMEPLNPFIQEHIPQVKTFYEGLTSNIDEDTTAIAAASGSVLKRDPEVFAHLHEVLAERLDIIRTHVERNHFSNLEKVELLESFLRDQQLIS